VPPVVITAVAGQSFHVPGPVERHPLEMNLHSVHEHHPGDQEDYLWGV
jgi:hypothetical protein